MPGSPERKFELSESVWYDLSPSNHDEFQELLADRDRFFDLCREYETALREVRDAYGMDASAVLDLVQTVAARTLEHDNSVRPEPYPPHDD